MRFIHAADIHLDSPLTGLSAYPDAPAEQLRSASREAFRQLISRAIDETVDFVVIAGDLYDGNWRDHNTGIFFCGEMGRLRRAGIPAYVLFGNHDAESEMTRKLALPDNVHCFGTRAAHTLRIDALKVALHGQSFRDKATLDNLAARYPAPVDGWFNIGVLHTALEGYAAHPSYAPCTVDELHARGYHYWALGHVHEYQQWQGASTIVFPGNLQGRSIRETGRRGAVLVTVEDGVALSLERLWIDVLRWEALAVDVSGCAGLQDAARLTGARLEDLLATDGHVPRAVRVTLTGRSRAHGELFAGAGQLRSEVLGQIATLGNDRLWLEKVKVDTEPMAEASRADRSEAMVDLQALLAEAAGDGAFLGQLQDELAPFIAKLPHELRQHVPSLAAADGAGLAELVAQVSPGLLEHIAQAERA
ncbi:MAG TPA: DNA repair exonuclease [Ramlibacter sp.]|nr:DNA repair exonuclease [Ramlibacter sp.]